MKIAIPRIATIGLVFNREVDPAGNYLTNESFLEEIEMAARTLAVNTELSPNLGDGRGQAAAV